MKGNQWVMEFVVGHLSQHIKDTVSFPSGLEYLHQEGSANFKPGYLYVYLLCFWLLLFFFFIWSLWSCHGTLGHVCSTELKKKKAIISNPFLSLSGTPNKSLCSHLALPPPGGVCVCLKA